jgi:DNA replication and repair protein RecF
LSPGRGLRRAAIEQLARQPESLGWKLRADVDGVGAAHQIETWAEPGQSRQIRIDGKAAAQLTLGRVMRVIWLVPAMDRLWIEAAEGRRRFLDRMVMSLFPGHGEVSLSYEKAMRQRNRLLKDQVADARWYRAVEAQMVEAAAAISANRRAALARIMAAQSGAQSGGQSRAQSRGQSGGQQRRNVVFPQADLALSDEDADLARALFEGRSRDLAAGRTLCGPHRVDLLARYAEKSMPAAQCSTGEQKALLISLILANARALAEDIGFAPVLLLDEVAAHLDPARRVGLYDEIADLNAQAFMTGTETALFEAMAGRGQTFVVSDDLGRSRIEELM